MYEETGYDLEGQLDPENVIELSIKQQKISLYIVPGVPEDYPFKTRTRKEISVCKLHPSILPLSSCLFRKLIGSNYQTCPLGRKVESCLESSI